MWIVSTNEHVQIPRVVADPRFRPHRRRSVFRRIEHPKLCSRDRAHHTLRLGLLSALDQYGSCYKRSTHETKTSPQHGHSTSSVCLLDRGKRGKDVDFFCIT